MFFSFFSNFNQQHEVRRERPHTSGGIEVSVPALVPISFSFASSSQNSNKNSKTNIYTLVRGREVAGAKIHLSLFFFRPLFQNILDCDSLILSSHIACRIILSQQFQ
jgi:hypothetical protein